MSHDTVLMAFVIVAALAILMQAWVMFGIWKAIEHMGGKIEEIRADIREKFDPLAESATEILANARGPFETITSNMAEISQTLRQRSVQVDAVVEELLEKTRVQIVHADELLNNLAEKVETTSDRIQQGVLKPIGEVAAAIKGLQTGWDFLFSRRRAARTGETVQDEQLFI